jgi:hypothetical protein
MDDDSRPATLDDARYLARFVALPSHFPSKGLAKVWLDVQTQLRRLLGALDLPHGDTPALHAAVIQQADRAALTLGARTERARARRPVRLPSVAKPNDDMEAVLDRAEQIVRGMQAQEDVPPAAPPMSSTRPIPEEEDLLPPIAMPPTGLVELTPEEATRMIEAQAPVRRAEPPKPKLPDPLMEDPFYAIGYGIGYAIEWTVRRIFGR